MENKDYPPVGPETPAENAQSPGFPNQEKLRTASGQPNFASCVPSIPEASGPPHRFTAPASILETEPPPPRYAESQPETASPPPRYVESQPEAAYPPSQSGEPQPSYFDGSTIQLIGWRLLGALLTIITLGIGAPWAECMILRWQTKHTVVEGQRLRFDGRGHQLLGRYLLWGLLILVTFGIYTIFLPVRMHKWRVKHTVFATDREPASKLSGGAVAVIVIAVAAALLLAGVAGVLLFRAYYQETELRQPVTASTTEPSTTAAATTQAMEETTGASVWYVNSPTGLYVRNSTEADYETIDYLEYGAQVIVEYWEGKLGFIGYGWCNGDYLTQEPPTGTPTAGSNDVDQNAPVQSTEIDPSVIGEWHAFSVNKEKSCASIYPGSYTFEQDGRFSFGSSETMYYYSEEKGIEVLGSGGSHYTGTYSYDGSTLTLNYANVIHPEDGYTKSYTETKVYPNTYVQGGCLYLNGNVYYQGDVYELLLGFFTE